MNRLLFSLILCIFTICKTGAASYGRSCYSHYGNKFKSIAWQSSSISNPNINVSLEDNSLTVINESAEDYILADTLTLPKNYSYTVKLSNQHNKPGKAYKYFDIKGTKTTKETHWGMALDVQPNGDKFIVDVCCTNTNLYDDLNDKRLMNISLYSVVNNTTTLIASKSLSKDVNLYDGDNTITAVLEGNEIIVYTGNKTKKQVFKSTVERSSNIKNSVGIVIGRGTEVKINRTMTNFTISNEVIAPTQWTIEKLKDHFEQSSNPVEGFWTYLDRDVEDKWMRIGGRYTIALVETDEGNYDIIYCDGAQVKKNDWQAGMLKGKMTKTLFNNVFNGMWVDATFEPINEDVQYSIENAVILTLKLPVYKSQIRFSKVVEQ